MHKKENESGKKVRTKERRNLKSMSTKLVDHKLKSAQASLKDYCG